ncbi:MAG: hypothetical protein HLUCCA01_03435 [Bacteroidetes bacterium HLUCCA01]|nr:MAG: hypothetical protein HLUCCA01_03435 [Bacteroidetes bacterium HLUCCA01]
MLRPRLLTIAGIIVLAAIFRFLPTPPNFAPVAAMAMFGGAYFADRRMAFLVPLAAMLLSDLFLGFHGLMWAVYLSFIAMVGIGILVARKKNFFTITAGAISGSILFFLVTNFAVWAAGGGMFYPLTLEGLMMSYTAALPFFHNTLAGDLLFTGVFFGGFELAQRYVPALQLTRS